MKRLKFEYRTDAVFDGPVTDHGFCLRCIPREDERQHLEWYTLDIYPETNIRIAPDVWKNTTTMGFIVKPHRKFGFCVRGEVLVDLSRPRKLWNPIFKYPTEYTQTTPEMEHMVNVLLKDGTGENPLSRALRLMNGLYAGFEYRQHVTGIWTTAPEAFKLGCGVCQDYAHILTAMCVYAGIPARYASGFMLGEGYTHAWVEVFSEGSWYGLDPTNNLMVDETYIKLAHGRHAADCSVVRGAFRGVVSETQKINVYVEELK